LRNLKTKICNKCKKEKPVSEFYYRNKKKEWYQFACKDCLKILQRGYMKKWYDNMPDDKKEKYLEGCREKNRWENLSLERKKRKHDANLEWRKNNPEKIKLYAKRGIIKYKKQRAEYRRITYRNNINVKIRVCLSIRLLRALNGKQKKSTTKELLGCSCEYFKKYIEKQFREGMTWNNHGKWHLDHIIPCSFFDLSQLDQQKKCFHYSNFQPLWASDNISKGNRTRHEKFI